MAISQAEFTQALGRFFSLQPVATDAQGGITVVAVEIMGVQGDSSGPRGQQRLTYRLLIDVSNLRTQLPPVWVLAPTDGAVKHVNIYRSTSCPILGRALPYLCWGNYPTQWSAADLSRRTLLALLENVMQHLNNPNFASRAR